MPPLRILLADDHPGFRAGIKQRLDEEDDLAVVAEAGDGPTALRLALEHRPDVLVLDIDMPGLTGLEVMKKLRAREAAARILILSAYDEDHYVRRVLEAGAAGYLLKQEAVSAIVEAVRGVGRGETGWLSRRLTARLMQREGGATSAYDLLSEREREVLHLLAQGASNPAIGAQLYIAESTVKKHVNMIFKKLGVGTRAEAVAWAWKHGVAEA